MSARANPVKILALMKMFFLQEYFVYFKKKQQNQGGNYPRGAEDDMTAVCSFT